MKFLITMRKGDCLFLMLLVLLLPSLAVQAQQPLSSPYSRYGIGELFRLSNNQTMAMGGAGIAFRDAATVNVLNPASYSAFDTTSFVFEGAITTNFQTLKTESLSQKANYSTIKHLLFGFPVTHWWKSSLGLLPYSQVGYKVSDASVSDSIGRMVRLYEGSGGINQVFLGHAFRFGKSFSAGVNVSYLFGTISRLRALTFPDSAYMRYFRVKDDISVNDFMFTYGLQYHTTLRNDLQLAAGAIFSSGRNITAKSSLLSETYLQGSTGIIYVQDTVENSPGIRGEIFLPDAWGTGISVGRTNKWMVQADVRFQDWSRFRIFGEKDSLRNSMDLALGMQYIPDFNSLSAYYRKISYRAGIRYSKTYLQLHSRQLNDLAFTLGFGLPLARTKSRVHLGFEFGRKGTTSDNLIQENYVLFSLGFSVFETWFYRKKFE